MEGQGKVRGSERGLKEIFRRAAQGKTLDRKVACTLALKQGAHRGYGQGRKCKGWNGQTGSWKIRSGVNLKDPLRTW